MATPKKAAKDIKPAGRKPIPITQQVCEDAYLLAASGISQKQIASVLGMGESTMYEKLKAFPEFLASIQAGQAEGIKQVVNAVYQRAVTGDISAAKYFLNNRDNQAWKDKIENTLVGAEGGAIEITEIKRTVID